VVGVCASGKSTLTAGLRGAGWNARPVSQEHSYVPDMWQRLTKPDILIFLDCALETIRRRRQTPDFPDWLDAAERERLRHARGHADLHVLTDALTPAEVLTQALVFLNARAAKPPA